MSCYIISHNCLEAKPTQRGELSRGCRLVFCIRSTFASAITGNNTISVQIPALGNNERPPRCNKICVASGN